ncbi:MAG: DNA primase, partial [Coprobacillaceae bacterium]
LELELTENIVKQKINKEVCSLCIDFLNSKFNKWMEEVSQDDLCSHVQMMEYCSKKVSRNDFHNLRNKVEEVKIKVAGMTAWRIDGTLREFPKFDPKNLWFNYPIHEVEQSEILKDVLPEGEGPTWKKNFEKSKKDPEQLKKEKNEAVETAYGACSIDGDVSIKSMASYMGVSEKTVRRRVKEHGGFWIDEGIIGTKNNP